MKGAPALLRIGWRETWRHRRRSALVIVLVALPIAVTAGALTAMATVTPTRTEERALDFGTADVLVHSDGSRPSGEITTALDDQLPPGSRVVPTTESWEGSILAGERAPEDVTTLFTDPADPIHGGRFRVDAGRLPRDRSEVTVSSTLADELDIGVGDRIELHPTGETVEIVGIVRERAHLKSPTLIRLPDDARTWSWWVDLPEGADHDVVAAGLALSATVETVEATLAPADLADGAVGVSATYLGGVLVFLWTGVVAAATFSIGARGQLREIGLVAANGGTRRQIRRLLVAHAAVLGLVGSLLGAAVGVMVSGLVIRRMEGTDALAHETGALSVPILPIAGAVALGVLCAVAAALRPAIRAARIPTTAALEGRMVRPPHHVRSVAGGLVVGALGVVFVGQGTTSDEQWPIAVGIVLVVVAAALLNRLFLAVAAGVTSRAGLSLRFATRDANRNPQRTGPAVVAAMVALAATAGGVTLAASYEAEDRRVRVPAGADEIVTVSMDGGWDDRTGAPTPLPDMAPYVDEIEQSVRAALPTADVEVTADFMELPSEVTESRSISSGQLYATVDLHHRPREVEVQRLRAAAMREMRGVPGGERAWVYMDEPDLCCDRFGPRLAAIGAGSAVSLLVLGLVAALSRSETTHELATLHALGISPRRRRRLAGAAAGVLALVAGVLAIPTGVLPAVAFLGARAQDGVDPTIVVPWPTIAAVLIGVTLTLTAAGWLTAGQPRRAG